MYIYGTYHKIKTGVPLFWNTLYMVYQQGKRIHHCECIGVFCTPLIVCDFREWLNLKSIAFNIVLSPVWEWGGTLPRSLEQVWPSVVWRALSKQVNFAQHYFVLLDQYCQELANVFKWLNLKIADIFQLHALTREVLLLVVRASHCSRIVNLWITQMKHVYSYTHECVYCLCSLYSII